ncbi:MAG: Rv3235 family protein [Mycolicibacterium neoaurum]|uniref:Rv3235 family protein n=1 Tax=Mycolicibacterium TaxID=1866885 RepID=UPI00068E7521|nr:Rv3235 family protein [Mycolicibacterium neoaurum]
MTSIPQHRPHPVVTTPIIDCEPPPHGGPHHRQPTIGTPRRRTPRQLSPPAITGEPPAPTAAAVFTDAALRRVLEVLDRRRPTTQLRGLLTPALIDAVGSLARSPQAGPTAILRRIRLRSIVEGTATAVTAAEVFATYTRGPRVRAIAARVEIVAGRWQLVALQIG